MSDLDDAAAREGPPRRKSANIAIPLVLRRFREQLPLGHEAHLPRAQHGRPYPFSAPGQQGPPGRPPARRLVHLLVKVLPGCGE